MQIMMNQPFARYGTGKGPPLVHVVQWGSFRGNCLRSVAFLRSYSAPISHQLQ
ncbi:hypothetical protein Tcan_04640 [Toxocara canis]|uniref:Uncharacterized protein n=1 Tax=Toxocara canis TaxID=6265 RepID=A0A0B2V2L4_TOXCA|nr:hypothetical protein Tcan_04640 [Toxocara canis]